MMRSRVTCQIPTIFPRFRQVSEVSSEAIAPSASGMASDLECGLAGTIVVSMFSPPL